MLQEYQHAFCTILKVIPDASGAIGHIIGANGKNMLKKTKISIIIVMG